MIKEFIESNEGPISFAVIDAEAESRRRGLQQQKGTIMITARLLKKSVPVAVMATTCGLISAASGDGKKCEELRFTMVAAQSCLPKATARVTVTPLGPVEKMRVEVSGLPPRTEFDFFVIQVPKAPFGLSWYQGDIETDEHGTGRGEFIGRFNIETFIVAPDGAPAPSVHHHAFPDATMSPKTGPIHTYHLGLWFNSPADAARVKCPSTVTPFNGEHTAGVQVLNTSNFSDDDGPLRQLEP